jgi:hypothetical protein
MDSSPSRGGGRESGARGRHARGARRRVFQGESMRALPIYVPAHPILAPPPRMRRRRHASRVTLRTSRGCFRNARRRGRGAKVRPLGPHRSSRTAATRCTPLAETSVPQATLLLARPQNAARAAQAMWVLRDRRACDAERSRVRCCRTGRPAPRVRSSRVARRTRASATRQLKARGGDADADEADKEDGAVQLDGKSVQAIELGTDGGIDGCGVQLRAQRAGAWLDDATGV